MQFNLSFTESSVVEKVAKSDVMKRAWTIRKVTGMSLSDALIRAWEIEKKRVALPVLTDLLAAHGLSGYSIKYNVAMTPGDFWYTKQYPFYFSQGTKEIKIDSDEIMSSIDALKSNKIPAFAC